MLDITKMKLYPSYSKTIFVPVNQESKYNVLFYPENANFVEVYPKLQIRKQYVKKITLYPSKVPVLKNSMAALAPYKNLKLLPLLNDKIKENVFIDCGAYLNVIDSFYGKNAYKRLSVVTKINDYLTNAASFASNKSILLYYVNMSKEVDSNILSRRLFPLYHMVKKNGFVFDIVCLVSDSSKGIKYIPIWNKSMSAALSVPRVLNILKGFIPKSNESVEDETITKPDPQKIPDAFKVNESLFRAIDQWTK